MTLEELDETSPNGFHDAEISSLTIDYAAGTARFHVDLWVGTMEDPQPERETYQEATVLVTGLSFCLIEPPTRGIDSFPKAGL